MPFLHVGKGFLLHLPPALICDCYAADKLCSFHCIRCAIVQQLTTRMQPRSFVLKLSAANVHWPFSSKQQAVSKPCEHLMLPVETECFAVVDFTEHLAPCLYRVTPQCILTAVLCNGLCRGDGLGCSVECTIAKHAPSTGWAHIAQKLDQSQKDTAHKVCPKSRGKKSRYLRKRSWIALWWSGAGPQAGG